MLITATSATLAVTPDRVCEWCEEPLAPWIRSNARTCSKACRQKLARFRVAPAGAVARKPMRFAYADPPYPGLARRYYRMPEVDHRALIRQLIREYPHGWALSTSSEALFDVLNLIPIGHRRDVRLCSWHRGSRPCPTYWGRMSWEPLILWRGRPRRIDPITPHDDSLVAHVMQRPRTHSKALVGMKPPAFCEWMFRQLGALEGDELHDMFPGSGVVGRAWKMYTNDTRGSRLAGATRHPREKR